MNIGIFSKFHMAGGSEFRCMELANGLHAAGHTVCVLGADDHQLSNRLKDRLNPNIPVHLACLTTPDVLYSQDAIVCINTDSKSFTTAEFWQTIDLTKIKKMIFLFNFIVSPARHLEHIAKFTDVRIITTNRRFFDEISTKEKHRKITTLPRMILTSPIADGYDKPKTFSATVRIGKHSIPSHDKWNDKHADLIARIPNVTWHFMGIPKSLVQRFGDNPPNIVVRKEFSMPVADYLQDVDIFLFYASDRRQEPWARSIAEAMSSGCPIVANDNDGGNRMQIIHGHNGFLCKDFEDFVYYLNVLVHDKAMREAMGRNSLIMSRFFKTETIIKQLETFLL